MATKQYNWDNVKLMIDNKEIEGIQSPMDTILEHIDNFCCRCGFFNSSTVVNSGYGCNHKDCDDGSHVKLGNYYWGNDQYIEGDVVTALAKRMTKRHIKCNRRLAKKFVKKARAIQFNNEELKKYSYKWQGACYTFTCPLGVEADEQDFIEHGEDPDYMTEGAWLVIDKV
jgi:hypothetical protein